ncbi:hypothetical protein OBBRIDRAFT_840383 [Obba rivulosa]|uniref:Uncharacterized protein n=1 Tax=Obba rivulosa TaxID=1052685 RepID=A0A8E2AFM5_9APHY|nr:hypothetical protein OBBRIDRAFT_840383 [Obba rivulosa]
MPLMSDGEALSGESDEGVHFGGLADEDEALERAAAVQSPLSWASHSARLGVRGPSMYALLEDNDSERGDRLTWIRMNTTSNRFKIKTATRTSGAVKKKPTTSNLPEHMREKFTQVLFPLVREHLGTLPAWTNMSLDDMRMLFDPVFLDEDHIVEEVNFIT